MVEDKNRSKDFELTEEELEKIAGGASGDQWRCCWCGVVMPSDPSSACTEHFVYCNKNPFKKKR